MGLSFPPEYNLKHFKFDLQRFDSAFSGGDGSQDNPYQISSVADLQQLSNDLKDGNTYEDKCFKLMANLDLSGVANFSPIGSQNTSAFAGTFDGDNANYTISNVTVNITNSRGSNQGGLVGMNVGTVDSCIVTGTVTFDTANHYVLADNTSTLATEANTTTYPDLIQAYKVTLNGVTASGDDIYLSDNNIAYVKTGATITLTTKNGYTVTSPAIINSDETISTTLDDTKNYIFGTEGNYTVASADNVKTNNYPDLMQVHKITVPEGVNNERKV